MFRVLEYRGLSVLAEGCGFEFCQVREREVELWETSSSLRSALTLECSIRDFCRTQTENRGRVIDRDREGGRGGRGF